MKFDRFASGSVNNTYATYTPDIPTAGLYEVALYYPLTTSTSDGNIITFSLEIHYDGGIEYKTMTQHLTGGKWVSLGSYPFEAGTSGYVKIYTQ